MDHDAFKIIQVTRKSTGETIRQQAEGFLRRGAVVPRDLHPHRRLAWVRAMPRQATAAARMARTHREACVGPSTLGNISLAGQQGLVYAAGRFPMEKWKRIAREALDDSARGSRCVVSVVALGLTRDRRRAPRLDPVLRVVPLRLPERTPWGATFGPVLSVQFARPLLEAVPS